MSFGCLHYIQHNLLIYMILKQLKFLFVSLITPQFTFEGHILKALLMF